MAALSIQVTVSYCPTGRSITAQVFLTDPEKKADSRQGRLLTRDVDLADDFIRVVSCKIYADTDPVSGCWYKGSLAASDL